MLSEKSNDGVQRENKVSPPACLCHTLTSPCTLPVQIPEDPRYTSSTGLATLQLFLCLHVINSIFHESKDYISFLCPMQPPSTAKLMSVEHLLLKEMYNVVARRETSPREGTFIEETDFCLSAHHFTPPLRTPPGHRRWSINMHQIKN